MSEENAGEPIAEPIDAPAPEPTDAPAPEGDHTPEGDDPAPEPELDAAALKAELEKSRNAQKKLEGRLGFKTKVEKDQAAQLAELRRQNEAYQQLVAAQGGDTPPAGQAPVSDPSRPPAEPTFTRAQVQAEAARLAAEQDFAKQCNTVYDEGKAKFPDFAESVGHLNDVGIMSTSLLEAALATDDAAAVLHHLGNDPDEAARVATLSPARMGAELAKLATRLASPKSRPVSSAPAPITPLNGSVKPELNVYDPKLSMGDKVSADYIAMRAKQGFAYARPAKDRSSY